MLILTEQYQLGFRLRISQVEVDIPNTSIFSDSIQNIFLPKSGIRFFMEILDKASHVHHFPLFLV